MPDELGIALEEENKRLREELEAMRRLLLMQGAPGGGSAAASSAGAGAGAADAGAAQPRLRVEEHGGKEPRAAAGCVPARDASAASNVAAPAAPDGAGEGSGGEGSPARTDGHGAAAQPAQVSAPGRGGSDGQRTASESFAATRRASTIREKTWSWQTEEGVWKEYEPEVCELVEQAFQMGQKAVCPSQMHVIVFHEMEQRLIEDTPPVPPAPALRLKSGRTPQAVVADKGERAQRVLSRPVRRHASHGRAEALIQLRERNAKLREGAWRSQLQHQFYQQQRHAELGSVARLHAASTATSALSAAAASAAAAAAAQSPGGLPGGGVGQGEGLVGIGCCLEYDPLLGVVFISSVRPGGSAALSGKVAVGDVIVKVDSTKVTCLEDAADHLVGPAGSLVLLSLLWRGRTATVALVRQHNLVLPAREDAPAGAGRDGEGRSWGVDIGVEVDFVKGVPTLLSLHASGAAASSQGLKEGDVIRMIDGEDPFALPHGNGALDVLRLRDALKGPPWSRVMLKVARGVHLSVPPQDKGGEAGGSGGLAGAGAGKGAGGCEEIEVAVVRAPDVTGDEVLFAAKVAYQAALVEAQQCSWLDGPRAKVRPASPFKHLLQSVDWIPQLSLDDEAGGRVGAGGGRGAFSVRGGVLGAAVMGLGEDIGGSANGMVLRVHDTITEQVHEVTSNVKENVARSVDNVKQVGEAVVEGVAPILESRWQVLQLGSRVTGLVRSAVSSVKGEGSARREKDTSRRGSDGTAGGGGRERVGRGRDGMAEAAEGRVTVPGGVLNEVAVAFSAACVETVVVNGSEYGAALLGECSQSSGLLSKVRATQKQLEQIHIWKEGSGGDARVRFMRLLFSDGSDLEAGARGSGGVYKGLVVQGAPFRLRFSSLRILDVDVAPGTRAHALSHSAALNSRPPASAPAYIPTGMSARTRPTAPPASGCWSHPCAVVEPVAVALGSVDATAASSRGQNMLEEGGGGRGDAKISLIGDVHLENKWTQFIKNEISSGEQAAADVRDSSNTKGGSREQAQGGADAGRGVSTNTYTRPHHLGLASGEAGAGDRRASEGGRVGQGDGVGGGAGNHHGGGGGDKGGGGVGRQGGGGEAYLADRGAKRERWLRPKSAARALVVGGDPNEFSSISCPELWESLSEEGVPVQDDPSVFRWRGKTLLHPFWSNGNLVVRSVPSGDLIYRGRPPKQPPPGPDENGMVVRAEDVEQLRSLFPGRLAASRARQLLRSVSGDVDIALAVLMDEDAES